MARPLVVAATTGITVSVVCLSLASVLGPGNGYSYPFRYFRPYEGERWGDPWTSHVPFIESGEIVTREFTWNGDGSVDVMFPGNVYYKPGPEWRVTVEGRESSVDHLRVDGGRIYFDAPRTSPLATSVEVRITGPTLETFVVSGSGKLILENIAQKEIEIDIRGSGSAQGRGTVGKLRLRIFGSGQAELGELATGDMEASIFGSGNAEVAPTGDAEVRTFGSGDVRLRTRPRHLSSRALGSGRIIQMNPGQAESPIASPGTTAHPEQEPIQI